MRLSYAASQRRLKALLAAQALTIVLLLYALFNASPVDQSSKRYLRSKQAASTSSSATLQVSRKQVAKFKEVGQAATTAVVKRPGTEADLGPEPLAGYFAMCLIARNEATDIVEWVEYHRALGASHFYIFDHNSSQPLISQLYPAVQAGYVTYEYFREFEHPHGWAQTYVYDLCLHRFGPRHTFMAFTDTDEYLVMHGGERLLEVLRDYEPYGGLAVNERLFGSGGHIRHPTKGGVLRNYNRCLPLHHKECRHVKTLLNTRHGLHLGLDPHHFVYKEGFHAVNEHFVRVGPLEATSHAAFQFER